MVFPAPLGPTMPVICPGGTLSEQLRKAPLWPNRLPRPVASIALGKSSNLCRLAAHDLCNAESVSDLLD